MEILYSFLAALGVSFISFIGILTLKWTSFSRYLRPIVAFAAGTLIADVCLHILPEVAHEEGLEGNGPFVLLGAFLFSFVLEGVLRWHHSHDSDAHSHARHIGVMSLVSDFVHNFVDGLTIAAAFALNPVAGIATTTAVAFHEIPQEIGNYAVLLHSGFSKSKALLYNFVSGLSALLGVGIAYLFIEQSETYTLYFSLFAAGSLLYIALADMVPEVHKKHGKSVDIDVLLGFFLGIVVISLLLLIEGGTH